ncbi:SH3 domain-containing protein [Flavobacteriales bacterium]|nr:SH3 domain-containing protein [Flavobacteriales bacterium]
MKKLLLILLSLPVIGFSQTDLSRLLFQLIDVKDARNVLESEGWETKSVNNQTDAYDVSYNEFKLSKYIDFSEGNSSRAYFTIHEYSNSNIITLKFYDKSFYNQFEKIIINSDYQEISQNIKFNTIEMIYKKYPLQIIFKEELNSYCQITLLKYLHKNKRESQHFKTNAVITADKVNVRSNPSLNSEILGQVNNYEKVWVDDETNIHTDKQFILDKKTTLYTNSKEYILNSGKMITQINSSVYYNGEYIKTDSNWLTASVNMGNKDILGIIRKNDISIATAQKWFKIRTLVFSGWVYGDFVEKR